MNPAIQLKQTTAVVLVALGLACFRLSPAVQAVSPAPEGGYPGNNTAEGQNALLSLTTGVNNTAIGWYSLKSDTTHRNNTAIGAGALYRNNADGNTAIGCTALFSNRTAIDNTANGAFALYHNDSTGSGSGSWNSAFGASALFKNTDGVQNAAFGESAMYENTTGHYNTAIGDNALRLNQTGSGNTAVGYFALHQNTVDGNTAVGYGALSANTTGNTNTAVGVGVLSANSTAVNNTAIGYQSLLRNTSGNANTASGYWALAFNTTGNGNTAVGALAGVNVTTATQVTCLGSAVGGENVSSTTWIGNVFNVTTQNGTTAPVIVSANGQLGTVASSERFKKDIATMEKASDAILSLRPVTFHYKTDTKGIPQFGLIAEEVAKVNPALVLPDKEGKPFSVRYDQVNAMLLNEFLKEHRTVGELKATIAQQQKQIEALTAGLQKVSAQLEAGNPGPQVAASDY